MPGLTQEQVEELKRRLEKDSNLFNAEEVFVIINQLQTPKPRIVDADKLEDYIKAKPLRYDPEYPGKERKDYVESNLILEWIKQNAKI